jgi:hypothetical protein
MEHQWSLEKLRQFIREERNGDQSLFDLVYSVDRGVTIFRYHFVTARDSLSNFYCPYEKASDEHMKRILGGQDQEEYSLAKIANEANTVAAIYTVRSLYDLFAQLVRSLLLVGVVSESDCNIHIVRDKLEHGELRNCIDTLLKSDDFRYINAFANVSKHRCLVKHVSSVDFVNDKSGVKFNAFEYRGIKFPALWSDELLERILDTKNSIVMAGNALNRLCFREQA